MARTEALASYVGWAKRQRAHQLQWAGRLLPFKNLEKDERVRVIRRFSYASTLLSVSTMFSLVAIFLMRLISNLF